MHGSRCIASATNKNTRVRILKKAHRVPNQGSGSRMSREDVRSNTCRRSASTTAGWRSNKSARTSSRVESPCAAADRTIRSPGNTLLCCERCVWNSRGTVTGVRSSSGPCNAGGRVDDLGESSSKTRSDALALKVFPGTRWKITFAPRRARSSHGFPSGSLNPVSSVTAQAGEAMPSTRGAQVNSGGWSGRVSVFW